MNTQREHLPALTAIRFFAAVLVYLFHLHAFKISQGPAWLENLSLTGFTGVSLFFVLSGFILVYTYGSSRFAAKDFYWARFIRVYPAYLFSLLLAAPIFFFVLFKVPFTPEMQWIAWFKSNLALTMATVLGLVQAWLPPAALGWNSVAWTLSNEAFFYAVYPLAFAGLVRLSRRPLQWALAACWAVSLALTIAYVLARPDGVAGVNFEMNGLTWLNVVRFNPLVRLPEFLMGMCCGLLFLNRVVARRWATPLILAGLFAFTQVIALQAWIPYPILHNGLLSPAYAAIIYGLALKPDWTEFFSWRPFQMLGEASYSFYLTHSLVIAVFFQPTGRLEPRSLFMHALCFALATLTAIAIFRFVEEPARRRWRKRSARPTVTVPGLYRPPLPVEAALDEVPTLPPPQQTPELDTPHNPT